MLLAIAQFFFTFMCFFLILIILVQKGKASMGLGTIGGGSELLFGGSGGQDIFQKITWVLVAIFLFGSLALSVMKTREFSSKPAVVNFHEEGPFRR